MKNIATILLCAVFLFSCRNNNPSGSFTITGDIKNTPDQKIYLEELFFSNKDPEVIDTAQIQSGHFTISGIAPNEGLYRLRLENNNAGFIFINDANDIAFSADMNDVSLNGPVFNTQANELLKQFIINVDSQRNAITAQSSHLDDLKNKNATDTSQAMDSIVNVAKKKYDQTSGAFEKYIIDYIDSSSDPVVTMFALGYIRNIDPTKLEKSVSNLTNRFPKNDAIASIVTQFSQMLTQYKSTPHLGNVAPNINMPDTSGKPFSLSSLRGKYVLIDFWASWCGPCRNENPNVVKAFNEFKDKNFTVLGVSLDNDKEAWVNAIASDKLTWNHISDFQGWNSPVVNLYGFDGIPYNVLIDPQGKIISTELRGKDLEDKLTEVLK